MTIRFNPQGYKPTKKEQADNNIDNFDQCIEKALDYLSAGFTNERQFISEIKVDTSKNYDFDEDFILMQYTGLKDKNGVDIFEGDIVKRTYLFDGAFGKTHAGEVVYDKEYARYVISKPYKHTEPKTEDLGNLLSCRSTYEVIGNIYENPELLEV